MGVLFCPQTGCVLSALLISLTSQFSILKWQAGSEKESTELYEAPLNCLCFRSVQGCVLVFTGWVGLVPLVFLLFIVRGFTI